MAFVGGQRLAYRQGLVVGDEREDSVGPIIVREGLAAHLPVDAKALPGLADVLRVLAGPAGRGLGILVVVLGAHADGDPSTRPAGRENPFDGVLDTPARRQSGFRRTQTPAQALQLFESAVDTRLTGGAVLGGLQGTEDPKDAVTLLWP